MKLYTLLLLAALPVLAADPVTGSWKFALNVNGNTYPMACTLQQDGEKLTGKCASEAGENPLTGTIQGEKITFMHKTAYNGDMLTLTYTGTVTSATEMKGAIDVQPFAITGDFTGQKDKEAAK